jgi:hypothetical protein
MVTRMFREVETEPAYLSKDVDKSKIFWSTMLVMIGTTIAAIWLASCEQKLRLDPHRHPTE